MDIKLFKQVNDIKRISDVFEIKEVKKGEIIFFERQEDNNFYYLISGKISLYADSTQGKRKLFFTIDQDDIINDVDFRYDSIPYEAIAFEKSKIMIIDQNVFKQLCQNDNQLLMNAMELQAHRTRRLYRQLKNTVSINIEKKIAAKLWKFAKDYGLTVDEEYTIIKFKLSNTYLSDIIGCSRETVSRAMQELIKLNLVKIIERDYYVKQEELLKYYRD